MGEFGTEQVRANIEPEKGNLLAGQTAVTGNNEWTRFTDTATPIEGVVVKALAGNGGVVQVAGPAGAPGIPPLAFPLAAGETVSISIDDLSKVYLFIAAAGDLVAYLAMSHTGD